MSKKKVVAQLPGTARTGDVLKRYALELEALAPIADIHEVRGQTEEEFIEGARDTDAIITTWGMRITKNIISKLDQCVVIGVGSVGVDMVDVEAATEAGIVVTNVPDVFIEEVADHAIMLLLAAARRVKEEDQLVHKGEWFKGRPILTQIPRLWGQTLGLISFGNVARAVARRAKPFGFHIVAYDPYVTELKMTGEGVEPVSLGELLERADYISLHLPLNDETHHMLSTEEFKAMKSTAVLVNTGRGPTIDESALIEALRNEQIAAAGLDVMEQEPPDPQNPLLQMSNVIITPHVASATTRMWPETRRRVGREVALALTGYWPRSCVNPTVLPRGTLMRWQPYPMERGPNR
ncbi:MAG: C-terminal binding protein [Deltaproteobacteria bacterium]|nr:C-terminal binding protein [Deltaproteobacteria bacterium]MBW2085673.1 C-terminal binding protein [Deltaproteobacteria bacterium]